MTSRSELKMTAKESLRGRWGFSIALLLIIFVLPLILNFIPLLGALIVLVITPALTYIPQQVFLKIKRNENTVIGEVFSSIFTNLGTYWALAATTFLKLLPWFAIMIVGYILSFYGTINSINSVIMSSTTVSSASASSSSIFALLGFILIIIGSILICTNSFYYVLAIYVKTDNPNMSCNEAIMRSKELMTGHRFEYFILALSFIGWALVGTITLGLGMFYVLPYMYTTFAAYYNDLIGHSNNPINSTDESIQF